MKPLLRFHCLTMTLTTAAIFMLAAPAAWADNDDDSDSDEEAIEFDEAELFFELNNTDKDLGIHSAVDGEPWKELEMEGPNGRELLEIDVRSRLRRQGLTQLFYESAEPTFEEQEPEEFFDRFPPGEYEISGTSLEGEEIESTTTLTHRMPAQPEPTVNMLPHDTDCDDDMVVAVAPPITIMWPAVDDCHPDLGSPQGDCDIDIHNYEVVVEADILDADGEEHFVKTSTLLPPGVTSYVVPNGFIGLWDEWKFEILVREDSFNQTAVESCFVYTAFVAPAPAP